MRYADNGAYCFACGHTEHSDTYKQQQQEEDFSLNMATEFTEEDHVKLKKITSTNGRGYRGIKDETYKHFGVRHEYDQETGAMVTQFYPNTTNYEFSGYKARVLPKTFHSLGQVGADNELFMQFRFRNSNSKMVVICAGEIDSLSGYQMLKDYQDSKGNSEYEATPVVSPTIGENCVKQLQKHYEWLSRFDKIILCFDMDDAGRKAMEKAVKVLPKGKVYVMDLPLKDTNEMMTAGREREWISAFFKARQYTPTGVVGSDTLYDLTVAQAGRPKLPFPPFMKGLNEITAGGIPLRNIINIGAASGIGKTSFVNEMIYYWVFNAPYKIGVVSMELDCGQYGEVMLSRHLGKKLSLIRGHEEKLAFIEQEWVQDKATELFRRVNGEPRWHLVDDRDGEIKSIQRTVEEMIISLDCQVIVLDPLQDLLDGLSNEEQAVFMKWQKAMVKSYDIIFININHVRKSGSGEKANSAGAFITEEDFQGSSSIFKSAGGNFLFMRDKYAEDPMVRNTTRSITSKCRWTGYTGPSGDFYYESETHTLHDLETWMAAHPSEF